MKVIVCGAGQVGSGIARQLARERNDVTVIDQSPERISEISETLDVRTVTGYASYPQILDQAGAAEADMLIAVTLADEVNMVACQVAHSLFDVPMKVARIRAQNYLEPQWQNLFTRDHMPIDVIISPEVEVGKAVLRRLDLPGAFEKQSFAEDKVGFVGITLEEDCPVVNTPLRQLTELFPDLRAVVVGVSRDGKLFVPTTEDQMAVGDQIYLVADSDHVRRALSIFGHEESEARRVIIVGGGNIGRYLARQIEEQQGATSVKIIEADRNRAIAAADELKKSTVLLGNGLNQDLLREAGIQDTETIVALTNDDEVNILTCMMAKHEGCERTLCLLNNRNYGPLMNTLGIDAFVDPRATTVSTILQHVRRGRIRGLHSIEDGAGEIVEGEALETSPLVGQPLREIGLPKGMRIGAVVKDTEVIIPRGDTVIEQGDRVIIFALAELIPKVEQMFRVSLEFF